MGTAGDEFVRQEKNIPVILFALFCSFVFLIFFHSLSDCFNLPKFIVSLCGITGFLCYLALRFSNMRFITIYANPLYLPLALFIGWKIIGLVFAINRIYGIEEIGLIFVCSWLIFIVPLVFKNARHIFLFVKIILVSSAFVAIYGIFQHFGFDIFSWSIKNSALSTFGRRNFAAEFLVLMLPWSLFALLVSKRFCKLLFVVIFFLLVFHLFLTFTRASWIGFIFSMLVAGILLLKPDLNTALRKASAIFLILLFVFKAYAGVFQFEKGTLKSRLLIWKTSIEMIRNRPISGYGTGNFEVAYYKFASEKEDVFLPQDRRVDRAHNEFIEVAVENGLVGLFLFLFFIFAIYRMFWWIYTGKKGGSGEKIVSVFAITSISGILVNSLASFPLQTSSGCFFFFLNCGILSRMYFTVLEQSPIEKRFSYPGIAFFSMASMCAVIVFSVAALYSSYSLERSKRIMRLAVERKDAVLWLLAEMNIKNAINYNPFSVEVYFHAGKLYLVAGQLESSRENFIRALKFNPYSEQVL
ncbi:MAG: O-antigen ligase family protein, partial [Candidatus Omnitrophica bacterium]|nr:O-antigen ligase family protein [Candidatus Omnitrophota bacterium]